MVTSMQQAYSTLGLTEEADSNEVKKAYRKLALQFHPDKNPDPAATPKFQQLSAAYKLIDDHLKRGRKCSFPTFDSADFNDGNEEGWGFDDPFDIPSMEEMLFMFDMLFGAPQKPRHQKRGKNEKGVRVQVKRKGGKRNVSSGLRSYVDHELTDLFAYGLMMDDTDADVYVTLTTVELATMKIDKIDSFEFEDELRSMASLFANSNATPASANKTERASTHYNEIEPNRVASSMPNIGSKVCIHGKLAGIVRFFGPVHYAKGEFVGVALTSPVGKNDGSIKGVRYFECLPCHGLMVRPNDVTLVC